MIVFSSKINENDLKNNYELYNRIQNNKRKRLLIFIYLESRNYTQLIEYSGLKPGSLYHHLSILGPLIEKRGHGFYAITQAGRKIVETMDFIDRKNHKPLIYTDHQIYHHDETKREKPKTSMDVEIQSDPLAIIWLGYHSYILVGLTMIIMILLGFEGISFAGSAIYAVGGNVAFAFNIVAFILGLGSLYYLELLQSEYKIYNKLKYIFTIRIISMLPGAVVGIGLLLLYLSNNIPSASFYPWIFGITLLLGTLTAASGIYYLRAQSFNQSLLVAIVPGIIDLLLGLVVLLSQY